jgi:hypothetical protein
MGRNGGEVGSRGFLWRPGGAGGEEKGGRGVWGSAPRERENREERKGPGRGGGQLGRPHQPPTGGRCRCRAIGEGGGARATLARAADRQGRATAGPSGSDGVRERVREWGSVARAADRRARQHSAARFGFKPIQTESKIFQTVQTDSKFFKLSLIQKVPSYSLKIGNKIWLERA